MSLTTTERRMTLEALRAPTPLERKAQEEAARVSLLAGCWEAMAVRAAMAAATEQREAK